MGENCISPFLMFIYETSIRLDALCRDAMIGGRGGEPDEKSDMGGNAGFPAGRDAVLQKMRQEAAVCMFRAVSRKRPEKVPGYLADLQMPGLRYHMERGRLLAGLATGLKGGGVEWIL